MKLLFDQNLSATLPRRLADVFPDSCHVATIGLDCSNDDEVWEYARQNGFAIVSKDEDYNSLSVLRGSPPKILWVQGGNCTTTEVESLIRSCGIEILAFDADCNSGTFVLR